MYIFKNQKGIGLIEVVIALLLLSIAVLGFSAMQMQAIKATDESLLRSDAMNAIRNLSEDIRLNPDKKNNYKTIIGDVWQDLSDENKNPDGYCSAVEAYKTNENITQLTCGSQESCDAEDQAKYNAYKAMQSICNSELMLNAIECPGTSGVLAKVCLIISWNTTLPEIEDDSSDDQTNNNTCASSSGSYRRGSSCLIMETY